MNPELKKFKRVIKHRKVRESAKRRMKQKYLAWKKQFTQPRPKSKINKEDQEFFDEIKKIKKLPIVKVVYSTDLDKLREKSKPVKKIDEEFIKQMAVTLLHEPFAVGLSAIQVGKPEQYMMVKWQGDIELFINPEVKKEYWQTDDMKEGCLSLPGEKVLVTRPKYIVLDYTNENNKRIKNFKATGVMARILGHELDHLKGKLIIDYEEK